MKLRIKGNSLRLRLSKTDVQQLAETGRVSDKISFGVEQLIYSLKCAANIDKPEASFSINNIIVLIPAKFAAGWHANNVIGIDAVQNTGNNETLSILIEKDFQCIDETTEDQSDNYVNPNSVC
jgi:hypothetical protein